MIQLDDIKQMIAELAEIARKHPEETADAFRRIMGERNTTKTEQQEENEV